jgi:hypothetical protein
MTAPHLAPGRPIPERAAAVLGPILMEMTKFQASDRAST